MKLSPSEIRKRISSVTIDLNVLQVEFDVPTADCETAQNVLTHLEDRRVLYNDNHLEDPRHCCESVIQIRDLLTSTLQGRTNEPGLNQILRVMRRACREFLNKVQAGESKLIWPSSSQAGSNCWTFCAALGEFRAAMGLQIALLCNRFSLGLEGDLTRVLPPAARDDD